MVQLEKYYRRDFFVAREYRHIEEYEKEILRMREEGKSRQEIGDILGFTKEQIKGFINRYNRKQRKIAVGEAIKKKGRPPKEHQVNEKDKVAQLRYIIDRKDAKIKSLEMENELMRDFLSLTGRK